MKNLVPQMSTRQFFDMVLPAYGTALSNEFKKPRWISGQKFWLVRDYLNPVNGNYYYLGARFVDNLMIVEKDAMWNQWTYLDDLEIWAFDGKKPYLIQKRKYDKVHRNEEHIRAELQSMLAEHLKSQAKQNKVVLPDTEVSSICKDCIDRSFKDFLDDDYEIRLTQMMPLLEQR